LILAMRRALMYVNYVSSPDTTVVPKIDPSHHPRLGFFSRCCPANIRIVGCILDTSKLTELGYFKISRLANFLSDGGAYDPQIASFQCRGYRFDGVGKCCGYAAEGARARYMSRAGPAATSAVTSATAGRHRLICSASMMSVTRVRPGKRSILTNSLPRVSSVASKGDVSCKPVNSFGVLRATGIRSKTAIPATGQTLVVATACPSPAA
jgi:hypothetical protein